MFVIINALAGKQLYIGCSARLRFTVQIEDTP